MQAFKCDRCGHFIEGQPHKLPNPNFNFLDDRLDICPACYAVFKLWLNKGKEF